MKKLFTTVLCTSLMSINLASFATETSQVKIYLNNVPLKTSLQTKYSAYQVEYLNEGQNPVRVNNISCCNKISIADTSGAMYSPKKKDSVMFALSPLTLGITGLVAGSKGMGQSMQIMPTIDEAKRFNAYDISGVGNNDSSSLKTNNEILSQGQSLHYSVLVPINDKPQMAGSFEDTVTHKYIRVESSK